MKPVWSHRYRAEPPPPAAGGEVCGQFSTIVSQSYYELPRALRVSVPILYGGSITPANAFETFRAARRGRRLVVGGASLIPALDFTAIVNAANQE
jgi:triosephosphate isomerase